MDQPVEPLARESMEDAQFVAGELEVERHSAELKKELTLPNLVFTQVLSILGLAWIGTAAKLGASHPFCNAVMVLFYIPRPAVVIHLNNEMPLEGGLISGPSSASTKCRRFPGRMEPVIYTITFVSEMGLLVTNNLAYAMGPSGAWLADSKVAITIANVPGTALLWIASLGLSVGKWVHGFAGFMILFLFAAMAVFAIPHWLSGTVAHPPLSLSIPAFTLLNLNMLGKMGFGAMGGFDSWRFSR